MAPSSDANGRADAILIERANTLKQKVGSGGFDPKALRAAEAAIAELAPSYLDWARGDLDRLRAVSDAAAATDNASQRAAHIAALFDVAHDMKGQGSTFNYPLVTRIANSLCRYVEYAGSAGAIDFPLIHAHIDAMRAVLTNQIAGAGGEVGQAIADELEAAARRKRSGGDGA